MTQEAERLKKSSFAIAFHVDRQGEEEKRGEIIACNTKKFSINRWNLIRPDTPATSEKGHLSIVICGHVGSDDSTTIERLLFVLGGIHGRGTDDSTREAESLGKSSFASTFNMDRQKEESERGMIIACNTKKLPTDRWNFIRPDTSAISEKDHLPIGICGYVDSGMNTTTGHQLYELGGIPERELGHKKRKALKNHPSRLPSTWTGAKRRRYEV